MSRLSFGITVGNFGNYGKHADACDLVENAVHAEHLGFDSVWVHDHLVMPATIRARSDRSLRLFSTSSSKGPRCDAASTSPISTLRPCSSRA